MSTTTRLLIAELQCLQCGRTAAKARQQPDGLHLTPRDPAHADILRRMRCPTCLGNLRAEDTEIEVMFRRRFTPDELIPRRGRPRKAVAP